jgi:ABC-type polysaccharide/polyol phosphate export permease
LCQEGNHEPSLFFSYIQNNASLRVCLQLNFELLCENLLFMLWFITCFMRILEIKILVTTPPPKFDYNYVSMWISLCLCFLCVLVLPFSPFLRLLDSNFEIS